MRSTVRPARRLRPACHAAIAAIAIVSAPLALADEFDWVYFPMYVGDTAHAVHLTSLKFRPDGLLSAATRYPRTRDDWSGPESGAGRYNYDEKLIDCQTGYTVSVASSLLDQQGAKLATRPNTREEQMAQLKSQVVERSAKWPDNSDRFLACAAASNSQFKRQRAAAAARVQPLFSDLSLVEVLSTDTDRLTASAKMHYDFNRIARRPAAPAYELFHDMRAQYSSWRKGFNAAYVTTASDPADDAAVLALANRRLEQEGLEHWRINILKGSVIEYTFPAEHSPAAFLSFDETRRDQLERAAADCAAGISVPVMRQSFKAGKRASTAPLKVKEVLKRIQELYGEPLDGPAPLASIASDMCRLVGNLRSERRPKPAAPAVENPDALLMPNEQEAAWEAAFQQAASLSSHATPQAMLLAIRAAVSAPAAR